MNDDLTLQTYPTKSESTEPTGLAGLAPMATLGEQLAAEAQQMAIRRTPAQPWLRALTPVLARLSELAVPAAARFRRIELGAEPVPRAMHVRPSSDEAGLEGQAVGDGLAHSAGVAPGAAHLLRAPGVGSQDTPWPNAGSVSKSMALPIADSGPPAEESSVGPGMRPRGTVRSSARSIFQSGAESADEMEGPTADAPATVQARTHDTIRAVASPAAGVGDKPVGEAGTPAQGALESPGIPDAIRPDVTSPAKSALATTSDKDRFPRGTAVSPDIRLRLHDLVGSPLPPLRVREDVEANAVARSQHADAVTMGNEVLFRTEHYRPHTPQGLALLAHEATHVVRAREPDVAWRRATAAGRTDEERQALDVERAALQEAQGLPASIGRPASARPGIPAALRGGLSGQGGPASQGTSSLPAMPAMEGATAPVAALQPMAATTGRDLQETPAPSTPASSLQELREALYRDLMRQLRADFERGG